MVNPYRIGRIHEGKVVRDLRKKRFSNIRRSAGSRGPADIYAKRKGTKYYIQVKGGNARIDSEGVAKLRALAKKRRGVAVSIHRNKGRSKWKFHGNWS